MYLSEIRLSFLLKNRILTSTDDYLQNIHAAAFAT